MWRLRYTVRIERMPDGRFRATVEGFPGFSVDGAEVDEVKAAVQKSLPAHIDDLQRDHEPVASVEGIDYVGPEG